MGEAHGGGPDNCLASTAWQYDDSGAAVPEGLCRYLLVGAQAPTVLVEVDVVVLSVDVAGEVFSRPSQLE